MIEVVYVIHVEWVDGVMCVGVCCNCSRDDGQSAMSAMHHIQAVAFVRGEMCEWIHHGQGV